MISSHAQTLSVANISNASHSSRALSTVLFRSVSLPRRPRPYQQIRSFRIGLWSSYLDANFQKEFRRRQQAVKHKYREALHRKLLWDRHFPMQLRNLEHSGLKGFMCSAWRGHDCRSGGRWVNSDDLEYMKRKESHPAKKFSGIEDVEQSALDQLLDSRNKLIRSKARTFGPGWSSHSASSVSRPEQNTAETSSGNFSSSSTVHRYEEHRKHSLTGERSQYEEHPEYEIDPITNRKVPKKTTQPPVDTTSGDIPVKTFRGYRSQFKDFVPPNAEEKGAWFPGSDPSPFPRGGNSPKKTQKETDDHLGIYEQSKNFKSTRRYDTSETDIDYSDPVQQGLKRYDEQLFKEPAMSTRDISKQKNEHDGLEAFDEKVKNKVRQFFASPDEQVEPSDPIHREIERYNAFKDVKPPRAAHLDKTDGEDKVLKARREYENSEMRRASLRESQANKLLNSIRGYEEITTTLRSKDTSIHSDREVHPLLKAIAEYEASVKDKKTDPREDAQRDGVDPLLHAIREYKRDLLSTNTVETAAAESVNSLALPPLLDAINEYEGLLLTSGVLDELRNGGGAADKADNEYLNAHDAKVNFYRKSHDIEKSPLVGNEFYVAKYDSASKFGPNKFAERLKVLQDKSSVAAEDSAQPKSWAYLPQRIRELFSREAKSEEELGSTTKIRGSIKRNDSSSKDPEEARDKVVRRKALERDFETTQFIEADAKLSAERLRQRNNILQNDIRNTQAESQESAKSTDTIMPANEHARKLTGNFVRDFPEEFQNSWTVSKDSSARLIPKQSAEQREEANNHDKKEVDTVDQPGSAAVFGNPNVKRVEPSLDRTVTRSNKLGDTGKKGSQEQLDIAHQGEGDLSVSILGYANPKTVEPSGTDAQTPKFQSQKERIARKEQDKDLVRELRSIYEDEYGIIDVKNRQVPAKLAQKVSTIESVVSMDKVFGKQEPTIYKILAYDPTMQSISSAETTSIVPDSAGPLTPAEVLLRLSNPSKFFPHFKPLRAQGYEIVSGSGDVLVFRKVRSALPTEQKFTVAAAAKQDESTLEHKRNVMNPIDGMTRGPVAATGDFASPTGFVNHDMPRGSEQPFKSNIDVRREEPVFSGKRNWQYEDEKGGRKRGSVTKTVLLSAGWLAACSYAIGVVSDYFRTGGSDGEGPKGF